MSSGFGTTCTFCLSFWVSWSFFAMDFASSAKTTLTFFERTNCPISLANRAASGWRCLTTKPIFLMAFESDFFIVMKDSSKDSVLVHQDLLKVLKQGPGRDWEGCSLRE